MKRRDAKLVGHTTIIIDDIREGKNDPKRYPLTNSQTG